jgi:hypothetical protein
MSLDLDLNPRSPEGPAWDRSLGSFFSSIDPGVISLQTYAEKHPDGVSDEAHGELMNFLSAATRPCETQLTIKGSDGRSITAQAFTFRVPNDFWIRKTTDMVAKSKHFDPTPVAKEDFIEVLCNFWTDFFLDCLCNTQLVPVEGGLLRHHYDHGLINSTDAITYVRRYCKKVFCKQPEPGDQQWAYGVRKRSIQLLFSRGHKFSKSEILISGYHAKVLTISRGTRGLKDNRFLWYTTV